MAWYDYRCEDCGETFTLERSIAGRDDPAACPDCGSEQSRRQLSAFMTMGSRKTGSPAAAAGGACCGGFT